MSNNNEQKYDPIHYSVGLMWDSINQRKVACATIVERGTLDLEFIANKIAESTTVTRADIAAVITGIIEFGVEYLASGYRLNLGDLGQLYPTLKARSVPTPAECDESTIEQVCCRFRSSVKLKHILGQACFERTLSATERRKSIKSKDAEMKDIMDHQDE